MNTHTHGNEGQDHPRHPHGDAPYWRRVHRDWRFWLGLSLMLLAITVFALSDNLALIPHRRH